jgi:hypothetical protein
MAQNNPNYYQYTSTVTLASGQNADSGHVDCLGAKAISFTVSCNTTHQLATASPQVLMTDQKQVTLTPGAFAAGTANAATNLNAAGVIITADLSTTTPRFVLVRAAIDPVFNSDSAPKMYGVASAWITLTKAATAGPAIYTVVTTVYY